MNNRLGIQCLLAVAFFVVVFVVFYRIGRQKLLHDWEGNTGSRGWQYWPDCRKGQYITRELNIPRNAI